MNSDSGCVSDSSGGNINGKETRKYGKKRVAVNIVNVVTYNKVRDGD